MRVFQRNISMLVFSFLLFAALCLYFRHAIKGNVLAIYDFSVYKPDAPLLAPPLEARYVAHAGGSVHGLIYTNSRDALNENYAKGYRVFELDFHWTSDGRLVLVHDWAQISSVFGVPSHVFSYREFTERKRPDGLHGLTFEELQAWLLAHPDALVVTDTKDSNSRLMSYIERNGGNILRQLVIQIYRLPELRQARQLAPRAVWLTLYKCNYPSWALSRIAGVDAFVIPIGTYSSYHDPLLMQRTHFYVHSVAKQDLAGAVARMPGIYGFYVD